MNQVNKARFRVFPCQAVGMPFYLAIIEENVFRASVRVAKRAGREIFISFHIPKIYEGRKFIEGTAGAVPVRLLDKFALSVNLYQNSLLCHVFF